MFFHIPLYVKLHFQSFFQVLKVKACRPEAFSKPDMNPETGKPLDVGISGQERHGNANRNDGFFEKGVLKALESDHTASRNIPEVKVIGNGHDHSAY